MMETTKTQVEEFLCETRELLEQNRRVLVPREVNLQGLAGLGIQESDAWNVVARLTVNNYSSGPDADYDGSDTLIWVFGCSVEKQTTYIKLKIEKGSRGAILKCLSFHPALHAPKFPLRP